MAQQLIHTENYRLSNSSGSVAGIILKGGRYGVSCKGSNYGTVTLQALAGDDSTYVTCLTAFSADGYASVDLPQGTYKITISSATAVYVDIRAIPIYDKE